MKQTLIKKKHLLLVPYQGRKGDYVIKSIKKRMKCFLPTDNVTKIVYVGNKLSSCFRVKDVTEFEHNHDIIYQGRCPEIGCNDHCLGETGRRTLERIFSNKESFQTFYGKWASTFRYEGLHNY